jgi:hypothetical protein
MYNDRRGKGAVTQIVVEYELCIDIRALRLAFYF